MKKPPRKKGRLGRAAHQLPAPLFCNIIEQCHLNPARRQPRYRPLWRVPLRHFLCQPSGG